MLDDDLSGRCDECGEWTPYRTSVRGNGSPELSICSRCLAEWYRDEDDDAGYGLDEEDDYE